MENEIIWIAAFVTLIAAAVGAAIIAVRRNGRDVDRLIKQLIIWASISALLPLTSFAGATMLHPRTRMKELMDRVQRVQQETYDTKDVDARTRSRDE
ncbi:MAG TPA: hypothetical protein VL282_03850, partial [Tepidisphaeraceae bacterium]|nr:hypothetical protein [Tepidisphaeraceae bacterium]